MYAVVGSAKGTVRFHAQAETNMQLEGLERHLKMIDSYQKTHAARARLA